MTHQAESVGAWTGTRWSAWRWTWLLLAAVVLLSAGLWLIRGRSQPAAPISGRGSTPRALPVVAEAATTGDVSVRLTGLGTVTPLSTGELEAVSGVVSAALFNAMNRGLEVRLASPLSRYDLGHSQLIMDVRKDLLDAGAVRDYADLRGRTIGILSFGSTVEMVVERALQRGGLTADDVNLVQMGAPDQISASRNRPCHVAASLAAPISQSGATSETTRRKEK